jgi:hypothetical protein
VCACDSRNGKPFQAARYTYNIYARKSIEERASHSEPP